MPIAYDSAVIGEFFNSGGEITNSPETNDRILWIDYSAPILKYRIMLHLDKEAVSVSGDVSNPFGADSMYEISVPCSLIVAGPDSYHPGQTCLSFLYGGSEMQDHSQMTIMKTPTGELKVWPGYPFASDHAFSSTSHAKRETTREYGNAEQTDSANTCAPRRTSGTSPAGAGSGARSKQV